ncbi:ileal sodium/bile acid cotransporter-like [Watersipora subatra]|uniref:ileal sodium/bile acid cotransporter-like n=1 Tax=Watersipora subatra TaxID=2589382 RepID=UPI00355B3241
MLGVQSDQHRRVSQYTRNLRYEDIPSNFLSRANLVLEEIVGEMWQIRRPAGLSRSMFVTSFISLCLLTNSVSTLDLIAQPPPSRTNPLLVKEETDATIEFMLDNCQGSRNLSIALTEGRDWTLSYPSTLYNVPCNQTSGTNGTGVQAKLHALVIGFVTLTISDAEMGDEYMDYYVGVKRPDKQIKDTIFLVGIIILSIFNTFCFGINLDLTKVKYYIKKPSAPIIGICCQFVLMPLISFTLTEFINQHPAVELGVFSMGVAPGGGSSNIWTFLLGGDIDLSITMTFFSSVTAIGFIPLWMYTLGQYIINMATEPGESTITIPFDQMALALTYIVIPIGIGLLIKRFLPKVAKVIKKGQTAAIVLTVLFAIGMGTYANIYAFKVVLFDYQLLLVTLFLPWLAFTFGFLIALAALRDKSLAVTVGLETAFQNSNLPTIMLRTSLNQPWADISTACPIILNMFMPVPCYFLVGIRMIYLKCYKKTSMEDTKKAEDIKLEGENPAYEADDTTDGTGNKNEKLTEL